MTNQETKKRSEQAGSNPLMEEIVVEIRDDDEWRNRGKKLFFFY